MKARRLSWDLQTLGPSIGVRAQVRSVNRDLLSVHKMIRNVSTVHFDSDGSCINNKKTYENDPTTVYQ